MKVFLSNLFFFFLKESILYFLKEKKSLLVAFQFFDKVFLHHKKNHNQQLFEKQCHPGQYLGSLSV